MRGRIAGRIAPAAHLRHIGLGERVELEPALVAQLQDGERGERLGHRGDAEQAVGVDRPVRLERPARRSRRHGRAGRRGRCRRPGPEHAPRPRSAEMASSDGPSARSGGEAGPSRLGAAAARRSGLRIVLPAASSRQSLSRSGLDASAGDPGGAPSARSVGAAAEASFTASTTTIDQRRRQPRAAQQARASTIWASGGTSFEAM